MVMVTCSGIAPAKYRVAVACLLSVVFAHASSKTPSPAHGESSFDCSQAWWQPVTALFGQDWPTEKKEWCCKHEKVGCAPADEKKHKDTFDCDADLEQWKTKWSDEQKQWCCDHKKRGCLAPEWSTEPYHCQEDLSEWKTKWSKGKKAWCCHFDNLGCEEVAIIPRTSTSESLSSTSSMPPTTTTLEPHDCRNGLSHWARDWTSAKRDWCCKHYSLGCPTTVTTSTTKETTSLTTTTHTTTSEGYDCGDAESSTAEWSSAKQEWCCNHERRGCTTCDTVCFVSNVAASCRKRIQWLMSHDDADRHNPCEHARHTVLDQCAACSRCDVDDACPAVGSVGSVAYHCKPGPGNEEHAWPDAKRDWCCKHHNHGCPSTVTTTTTRSYDCTKDVKHWQTKWDRAKRIWCCKESRIGCTACDANCALQGFTASCRARITWLQTHDFSELERACESARTVVLDQCQSCSECSVDDACPSNTTRSTFEAEDCEEDFADWERTWSHAKKQWCCEAVKKGCPKSTTTLVTTSSAAFDCQEGLSKWSTKWSLVKRAWCCVNERLGCPKAFNCKEGLTKWKSDWTPEKQTWCCKHEGLGCKSNSWHGNAPFEPYDCSSNRSAWPPGKKAWCCAHHSIGCYAMETTTSAPYDCKDDVLHWAESWSAGKQEWCCKNFLLGCPTVVDDTPKLAAAQAAAQFARNADPYDCLLGFGNWQKAWSGDKAAWCCEHKQKGCGALASTAAAATVEKDVEEYDCKEGSEKWQELWSHKRQRWCCDHRGRGCHTTTAAPSQKATAKLKYKCYIDELKDIHSWSTEHRAWCCKANGVGCTTTTSLTAARHKSTSTEHHTSSTKLVRTTTSLATTTTKKTTTIELVTTSSTASTGFDCEASAGSQQGWSQVHREWCCKHAGRGCHEQFEKPHEVEVEGIGDPEKVANKPEEGASKVSPSPASSSECFEQNVAYLPLDMLGTMLSYLDQPEDCQKRCQNTANCAHFSYYVQEKICHISDMWAHPQYGYIGVVSGPPECELGPGVESLTWIEKDALPEVEGEHFAGVGDTFGNVDEMKRWCEEHADCVGFARQPGTGRWYPSKVGTGFDPRTAVWASSWGENWRWYYIKERTEMASPQVQRKFATSPSSSSSSALLLLAPHASPSAAAAAAHAALVCSMGFVLALGAALAVRARARRDPGYLVVGQIPQPLVE
mmetsp:Transcript_71990/g.181994  ORF Transcript_71990/g.181994 Transcript_71990/m.181994 type:complete len:1187 (-) Transcript_71990:14-3574(-)